MFDLTYSQSDIYFDQIARPESPLYNVGGYIQIGSVDRQRIAAAHARLVAEHDAFGIRVREIGGEVRQYLSSENYSGLPLIDFSSETEPARSADSWLASLFETPLPVLESELFRAYLLVLGPNEHRYVGLAHHLAMDGWGFANWAQKLSEYYQGLPSTFEARHGAEWEAVVRQDTEYVASTRAGADSAYWQQALAQLPEPLLLQLPLGERDGGVPERSQRLSFVPSPQQLSNLDQVAARIGIGRASVLQALWCQYLYGATGRDRFVIGLPLHNRTTQTKKRMLGVFAAISPLLVELDAAMPFAEFALSLAEQQRKSLRHQRYPIGRVLRELRVQDGRKGLYQVVFNYLRVENRLDFDGAPAQLVYLSHHHEPTPLTLTIWEQGVAAELEVQLDFNLAYFTAAQVAGIQRRLSQMLSDLPDYPTRRMGDICVLSSAELADLSYSPDPYAHQVEERGAMHVLFESMAAQQPDAVAAECAGRQLSYGELNQRADKLAMCLLARGLQPESAVGICVERSFDMLVGVLAIWKAGCAYVPLDPNYPAARLNFMLEDSGAQLVLIQRHARPPLPAEKLLCLDDESMPELSVAAMRPEPSAGRLAYVIYTSGSTGTPKGVCITHANTLALLRWAEQTYTPAELRAVLASTSLNFDLSVFELFVPLCLGYKCVLVPDALWLLEHPLDISLINTVPSAMKHLLGRGAVPASVQVINLAGEPLSRELLNGLLRQRVCRRVFNLYGPTEDTTYSTAAEFRSEIGELPHIGQALPGSRLYVLSPAGRLLPPGSIGELYIGGAGVARGYLNRPELTQARFVPDPFSPESGRCMYRTGDLVRWRTDGNLAFEGRIDDQVKIRGFRVELGEVAAQLACQPEVQDAVLVARGEADNKQLVAYIVPQLANNQDLDERALIAHLRARLQTVLADYMLPSAIVLMEAFPLTLSGKIDKRALPAPVSAKTAQAVEPRNLTERQLLLLWQELLGAGTLGVDDDFFESGGNSLLLTQMIHRAYAAHRLAISVKDVYQARSVSALVRLLEQQAGYNRRLVTRQGTMDSPLSSGQRRILLAEALQPEVNHNIVGALRFAEVLRPELLRAALQLLVQRHDGLRTSFSGIGQADLQTVSTQLTISLEYHDLRATAEASSVAALLHQHAAMRFDVSRPGLFSVALVVESEEASWLQVNLHHAIADGWSAVIFYDELLQAYRALAQARQPAWPTLPYNFRDYAVWQRDFSDSPEARRQEAFWGAYLRGAPGQLRLPFQGRVAGKIQQRQAFAVPIDLELRDRLRAIAQQQRGSLANIMQAALALLLARVSGESEIVLGMPVAGRNIAGCEGVLGMFLNNLPLRTTLDPAMPFTGFLAAQIANLADVLSHQDLPFERIVAVSGVQREPGVSPLFQVCLNILSLPVTQHGANLFQQAQGYLAEMGGKFNLCLYLSDSAERCELHASYDNGLYQHADIEVLLAQYLALLEQIAVAPEIACGRFSLRGQACHQSKNAFAHEVLQPLVLPDGSQSLSQSWIGSVGQILRQIACADPGRLALESRSRCWSYAELDQDSSAWAAHLQSVGVRKGDVVAVLATRSPALVLAMLAILKAGGAFMLLSPEAPEQRLVQQVMAVPPRCLVLLNGLQQISASLRARLEHAGCIQLVFDEQFKPSTSAAVFSAVDSAADDLAYIAFTSGTEGRAKAIRGHHGSLTMFAPAFAERHGLTAGDRFGLLSGLVHDPLLRDVFLPLALGATLCVPSELEMGAVEVAPWLARSRLTVLNLTPSMVSWLALICRERLTTLRRLFVAGEILTAAHQDQALVLAPGAALINLYGATETGRALASLDCSALPDAPREAVLPLGFGLAGVELLVLNPVQQLCGVGEVGQIGIRSNCLTLGYLNDPALDAAKFISNPFRPAEDGQDKIFLTGDLGRYRRDGLVDCLGRRDGQVKVRGFRIELSDIEVNLCACPGVQRAAAVIRQAEHGTVIEAVVQPDPAVDLNVSAVMAHLAQRLPHYMMPHSVLQVDSLPLNENGKLDRARLPQMSTAPVATAPANAIEEELLVLWRRLFQCDAISVTEPFFRLGGNSLLATQLLVWLREQIALELSYQEFFAGSSIREVAQRVAAQRVALRGSRRSRSARQMTL
nr:non-ribosomal peptide synthetase [Duganella lactea]